jgi:hypothetical protein
MPKRGYLEECLVKAGCICDPLAWKQQSIQQHPAYAQHIRWSRLVSMVLCICLTERDDRKQTMSEECHRMGLCRLVKFLRVYRPTPEECTAVGIKARGMFGCWDSHQQANQIAAQLLAKHGKAVNQINQRAMILEDDCEFQWLLSDAWFQRMNRHFHEDLPKDWQMYKLG